MLEILLTKGAWMLFVGLAMLVAGIVLVSLDMMTGGPVLLVFSGINTATGILWIVRGEERAAETR